MFILLAALLTIGQQPAAGSQPEAVRATATLRGHVLGADTGQPLRKAQVRITAPELRENRLATTDDNGRYEFKNVKAGRYTVSVSKGSYIRMQYGQTRPTAPGTPLDIKDGQTVERIDFSLPRSGIITGRILDEFGEPLSEVVVAPMAYVFRQGKRTLASADRTATSDDNGEFRIFGLPPTQYYLQATWRTNTPVGPGGDNQPAYAPLFFPGVLDAGEAQRFAIGVGQEISDLVMGLKPTRAVRVSGTIMTSDGKPMMGMLSIMRVQGQGFMTSMATSVRPDGSFQLNAVAPGEYQLRSAFLNGAPGSDTETAFAKIAVAEEDITGLQLVGAKPSLLRGRVIVDPGAAQSLPAAVVLNAFSVDGPGFSDGAGSRMADDYTFEVKAMAGRSRIALGNAPPGWSIRAVRLNGVDVIDTASRSSRTRMSAGSRSS